MLSLLPSGRILIAVEPVDGRKGIYSLAGVVRSTLKGDPLSGDLFVFKTRRGDKLKILAWMPEQPAPRKRKGHGRRRKPADLPRRREEIDLSDAEKLCACCGTAKICIGQIFSERFDYQPMSLFVRELVRPTYVCRSCESQGHDPQIARAALPPEPIPKSGIGSGLLAHVIVSKMVDHMPLHRQESILARHGWDVCRSTLCDHLKKCGELLTPLYDLMRQRLLRSFAIHADDTPLVLLRTRRAAFAGAYLGDVLDQLAAGMGGDDVSDLLPAGWAGHQARAG
jgi:transposase